MAPEAGVHRADAEEHDGAPEREGEVWQVRAQAVEHGAAWEPTPAPEVRP